MATVDGIQFVAGRRLLTWLRGLDGDVVSKGAARDVVQRLERFRSSAWQDT